MAISVQRPSVNAIGDTRALARMLVAALEDMEDQINGRTNVFGLRSEALPKDVKAKDVVVTLIGGKLYVGIHDGRGVRFLNTQDIGAMPKAGLNFLGMIETAAPPTAVEFPAHLDWGFHNNTAGAIFKLVFNFNGAIKTVTLA